MRLSLITLFVVCLAFPDEAQARFRLRGRAACAGCPSAAAVPLAIAPAGEVGAVQDALAEVNAQRAARGMRPYLLCLQLQEAARACATYRARWRIVGHLQSDFVFLPPGARASCTGCAAWPPSMGFGACEIFGGYTYAGAATVRGADGLNYCHLFLK